MGKKKSITKKDIISFYMEYVLENNKKPQSVYNFSKAYNFDESLSIFGEKFVGLPLDDDSDEEQNKLRIEMWTDLLKFDLN